MIYECQQTRLLRDLILTNQPDFGIKRNIEYISKLDMWEPHLLTKTDKLNRVFAAVSLPIRQRVVLGLTDDWP